MIKLDLETIKNRFSSKGYELLSDTYVGKDCPLIVKCPKGHITETLSANNFRRGSQCKICYQQDKSRSIEIEYSQKVKKELEDQGFCLLTEYKNSRTKLTIKCPNQHEFRMIWGAFQQGQRCPQCSVKGRKEHSDGFIKNILTKEGYIFIKSERIKEDQSKRISMICPKNHTYETYFNNFFNHGHRCNQCFKSQTVSTAQREIYEFIKSNYSGDILLNDRSVIYPLEADIYIPAAKLAIEFNGLYWHSEEVKKYKSVNIKKENMFRSKDINFFAIYEDEWRDKQELIKKMIGHRLSINTSIKLRATETILKEVSSREKIEFFKKFHLDGDVKSQKNYGLYHNGTLVSCMSFRWNRRHNCWEIARFANDYTYKIYGSASKLLTDIPRPVITYSNNRLSRGYVYEKIGFNEITETTNPSYWYTDKVNKVFRTQCQRINLPDIILEYPTECSQARAGLFSLKNFGHNRPLYKVYDYGHRKWILK